MIEKIKKLVKLEITEAEGAKKAKYKKKISTNMKKVTQITIGKLSY